MTANIESLYEKFNQFMENINDYDRRIEAMNYTEMVEWLNEISEANGFEITFSDCELKDDPNALYIRAYNSCYESRIFSTTGYIHIPSVFEAAFEWAYRD
jgi:hypothetical protein